MPLHVIPLVMGSAFLLVTEYSTHVVKASDIMSGNASFAKIAFPPAPPNGQRRKHPVLAMNWGVSDACSRESCDILGTSPEDAAVCLRPR